MIWLIENPMFRIGAWGFLKKLGGLSVPGIKAIACRSICESVRQLRSS